MYASGKHTGENNSPTLVVANAGWKVNQWIGYSVTNTTRSTNNQNRSRIPSQQFDYGKYE